MISAKEIEAIKEKNRVERIIKYKTAAVQDCKDLNWENLKSLIDNPQNNLFYEFNVSDEFLAASMSCKLLVSACFEAYHIDYRVKKRYGLNIWNKNLYWHPKPDPIFSHDLVSLFNFQCAYLDAKSSLKDKAICAQILCYVNKNKKILCSMLSDPEIPKEDYQSCLNAFDGAIEATPQLTTEEKNRYLKLMYFSTETSIEDREARNYVSGFKRYKKLQEECLFGKIFYYGNTTRPSNLISKSEQAELAKKPSPLEG